MGQIDSYVNSVYKNVGGNKEEINILKEEMRYHLIQLVEELKLEGKSEEESISIAIKRFGEETQIEDELFGVFQFVNKKAKKVLMITLAFFIMATISFSAFLIGTQFFIHQELKSNSKIFNIMSYYNKDNTNSIDENVENVIKKSKGKIEGVMMYQSTGDYTDMREDISKDLEYAYPKGIQNKNNNNISFIGQQISTEKGVKYNVSIRGMDTNAWVPAYIKVLKNISIVFLGFSIISMIAWILVKLNGHACAINK
ncbi:permease prefix domain 1-containing protein [Clostridium botulinum]|uniref:Uncharacterized protein n=1 Tax=Clostridium botulinum TaxID=1491 RepID=A0A9Q1ZD59_CLOBO|nr:permease prefix domain 1-containing protein [Clostridium botulinum]AEB76019.1 conserved hypothetical protein [Clostridium botulinum BKT015925]KEI03421.1 hypothetical protein Z953_04630 [Clostridium botulinum D str. 16868]KEI03989.1 hypothetical protein Y848_03850 [Clostridium botulinum C/D str. Sp77]KLU76533.1 hypothetical protein CBC3_03050 [Clostridium botulinum V891]KOA72826.1 hypothetical protein ADU78_14150 [Clostridium botulinum]